MVTLSRIVMLVGSRNLDADTIAYHNLVRHINQGLRCKYGGEISVFAQNFERGSLSLVIMAPDAEKAYTVLRQVIKRFSKLQEERFKNAAVPVMPGKADLAVLAVLVGQPDHSFTADDLTDILDVSLCTINRALGKLLSEEKVVVTGLRRTRNHGYGAREFQLAT